MIVRGHLTPPYLLNGLHLFKGCGNLVKKPGPDEEKRLFMADFKRNSAFCDYYHLFYLIVNSQNLF